MPATATVRSTGSYRGLVTDDRTLATLDHLTDMALYLHEALIDGYAPKPTFMAPALTASRELQQRFHGTALEPVLIASRSALEQAQQTNSPAALAEALAALVAALEPWLLGGAPDHYRAAGLTLFRDRASGDLWLQESPEPLNPYGAAAAEALPWPTAAAEPG